jgi:O-antigen ligase
VDPNSFGTYTMLLTFMCLFSIDVLGKDSLTLKTLKIAGILSGLYLEMKSQTRGAWIAEPIMLALWLALHWRSKNKLVLLSSVLMCLFGILSAYFFIDFFQARVNSIYLEISAWLTKADTETPTGFRLSMWQITWTLFKQSPWHGYGDLGYQYKLLLPEFQSVFSRDVISLMRLVGPHNECLANMLRSGIFGLIAVLLQFFVPAAVFIRGLNSHTDNQRIKGACAIGLCLVVGMLIASISMEVLTLKYANSFYGLMIAGLCASVLWEPAPENRHKSIG